MKSKKMEDKKITLPIIRKAVANRLGRDEDEIGGFLNALFSSITSGLRSDKTVKINNLGTFSLQTMAPRKSVNISTGEAIVLDEYNKVVFEAESTLKTELNAIEDENVAVQVQESIPTKKQEELKKQEKLKLPEKLEKHEIQVEKEPEESIIETEKSQEIMIDNNEKPVESVANEELEQRELNPEMFQKLDDQANEIVSLLSEMGQPVVGVPIVAKQESEQTGQANELLSEIENLKRQLEQLSTLQQTAQSSLPDQKSTILPSGMMATSKPETKEVENTVPNEEPQIDDNQPSEELQAESTVEQPVEPIVAPDNSSVQAPSEEPIDDENNRINKNINPQKHRKMSDYDNNLGYGPMEDNFEEQEEKRGMSAGVIALIVVIIFALLLVIAYFFFQDKIQAWLKSDQATEQVIAESDDLTEDFVEESEESEDIVETPSTNASGYDIYHRTYTEFIATERLQYGVWLAQLSRKYYNGEKDFWVFIYEANKDRIKNPNKILRGTSIRIPKLDPELMDLSNPEVRKLVDDLCEQYKRIH